MGCDWTPFWSLIGSEQDFRTKFINVSKSCFVHVYLIVSENILNANYQSNTLTIHLSYTYYIYVNISSILDLIWKNIHDGFTPHHHPHAGAAADGAGVGWAWGGMGWGGSLMGIFLYWIRDIVYLLYFRFFMNPCTEYT